MFTKCACIIYFSICEQIVNLNWNKCINNNWLVSVVWFCFRHSFGDGAPHRRLAHCVPYSRTVSLPSSCRPANRSSLLHGWLQSISRPTAASISPWILQLCGEIFAVIKSLCLLRRRSGFLAFSNFLKTLYFNLPPYSSWSDRYRYYLLMI